MQTDLPIDPHAKNLKQTDHSAPPQKLPRVCVLFLCFGLLSCGIYLLFRTDSSFADWFNRHISSVIRQVLATATAVVPFSFAELLIWLIPLFMIVLIVIACKKYCRSWHSAAVFLGILLSAASLIWSCFVWAFAAGYSAPSLDQKLGLDREKVSAEQLYATAEQLREELERLAPNVIFSESGASVMPYSYADMTEKLLDAYDLYTAEYDFVDDFHSPVKPILLSEPMSYTHITGVYTFFTGEANINVHFPDYTLPYTAAHELAHQRGIAREDEANFIAFLVCMRSDDVYIRYSAYLNVYEYVLSALSSADRDLYWQSYSELPQEIIGEEKAYSVFYDQYRDNVVADISQSANHAYLQSQGAPEGSRSYNLVVDLTVAYYRSIGAVS